MIEVDENYKLNVPSPFVLDLNMHERVLKRLDLLIDFSDMNAIYFFFQAMFNQKIILKVLRQ